MLLKGQQQADAQRCLLLLQECMKLLDLKPTHKAVTTYYAELQQLAQMDAHKEGAVSPAFANLLRHCVRQINKSSLYKCSPISTFFNRSHS
jgi:hypothetical protein